MDTSMLWVFIFPLGMGYLSLILCPLPMVFKWLLFVTKNNSAGVSRRSTHGKQMISALLLRSHQASQQTNFGGVESPAPEAKFIREI